jgi:hypothetical protein
MEHKHEPISNSIFETYSIQERVKEQKKAIKLLVSQGYTISDMEGNIMAKSFTKFDDEGNLLESGYTKRI